MQLSDFDYELPEELIAQMPLVERDQCRLLALGRDGSLGHRRFCELPDLLDGDDLLVLNDTRVFPARLIGRKPSGGKVGVLLSELIDPERQVWLARAHTSRSLRAGATVLFSDELAGEVVGDLGRGRCAIKFHWSGNFAEVLERCGAVPLPPYIKRSGSEPLDREHYQTVFASQPGACAAPTAALHFTPGLLDRLRSRGLEILTITLHVGPGTFEPVRAETLEDHRMEGEWCTISREAAEAINRAKERGRRIVAAGTTSTRALESAWESGSVRPGSQIARLFITPGYRFRVVDRLLTNFHLPRSTPLVLVSAFAGREKVLSAYEEAKRQSYRFCSYGDAFLAL